VSERVPTRSGGWLYVEEAGNGPPVLALHGLGGGAWFFSGLAQRLASDCRFISIDLPGTGRSVPAVPATSTIDAMSAEAWISDLGAFVAERIGEPVVLLGHSMGTILALEAWHAWPDGIRGLIFAGGLPEARPLIRERLTERALSVTRAGLAGLGPTAAAANFSPATPAKNPELMGLFARLFELQDAACYVRCCEILIGASAAAVVASVVVPCLSISGSDDQYAPPDLVTGFMQQLRGRHEQIVIPECGHLPFLEAPEVFEAAVRSFLATLC
jgi:pimeloyl-ACP methyl ester carboxylesterase